MERQYILLRHRYATLFLVQIKLSRRWPSALLRMIIGRHLLWPLICLQRSSWIVCLMTLRPLSGSSSNTEDLSTASSASQQRTNKRGCSSFRKWLEWLGCVVSVDLSEEVHGLMMSDFHPSLGYWSKWLSISYYSHVIVSSFVMCWCGPIAGECGKREDVSRTCDCISEEIWISWQWTMAEVSWYSRG